MAAADWDGQRAASGPIAADQLERHGFVHCCTREQIPEIAAWWLRGEAPLVAVAVDAGRAGDLRFERADLGRAYPHVYNPLPRQAVLAAHELPDTSVLPAELAEPPPMFAVSGRRDGAAVHAVWQAGRLVAGDDAVRAAAERLVASGASVPQFPGVSRPASLASAYDAFCVLAALLDEIESYRGDGFFEPGEFS